jgi:hypothetical protein
MVKRVLCHFALDVMAPPDLWDKPPPGVGLFLSDFDY